MEGNRIMTGPEELVLTILRQYWGSKDDESLISEVPAVLRSLRESHATRDTDPGTHFVDAAGAQTLHAEMIQRNLDLDALDLFNQANGICGQILPDDLTYTDYVEWLRS